MKYTRKALLLGVLFSVLFMLGLSVDGITLDLDQQGQWDFIESRIDIGYRNWNELIDWAEREDIAWYIYENDEPIALELFEKIQNYGILGRHLRTTPSINRENEEEVILIFHWIDVRHDAAMEELFHIDRLLEEPISTWLTRENLNRLNEQFIVVNLLELDYDGEEIIGEPFAKDFISWNLSFTPLLPREESVLTIELTYRVTNRPSRDEMQQILQDILDELGDTEGFRGTENRNPLSRDRD